MKHEAYIMAGSAGMIIGATIVMVIHGFVGADTHSFPSIQFLASGIFAGGLLSIGYLKSLMIGEEEETTVL